jgi:hypothetical protein
MQEESENLDWPANCSPSRSGTSVIDISSKLERKPNEVPAIFRFGESASGYDL